MLRRRSLRSALVAACLCLPAAGSAHADTLTWSPPKMTGATTIQITRDRDYYALDADRDYILKMPSVTYNHGGLTINGGRNVTLIGGHIWVPEIGATALKPRRGLLLTNQRGIVHVEGLRIDGPGLSEGIQLGQPHGASVRLQNIYVAHVRARDRVGFTDNHPDVVQTWAGPKRLLIDRLTGTTDLQGLMLEPTEMCQTEACKPSTVSQRTWDFRNIDIHGTESARILFWKNPSFFISEHNIWGSHALGRSPASSAWPSLAHWYGVTWAAPPARMVAPENVGLGYRRPTSYRY